MWKSSSKEILKGRPRSWGGLVPAFARIHYACQSNDHPNLQPGERIHMYYEVLANLLVISTAF